MPKPCNRGKIISRGPLSTYMIHSYSVLAGPYIYIYTYTHIEFTVAILVSMLQATWFTSPLQGEVVAWGDPTNGGDCQEVAEDLRQGLVSRDLWSLSNSSITIHEDVFLHGFGLICWKSRCVYYIYVSVYISKPFKSVMYFSSLFSASSGQTYSQGLCNTSMYQKGHLLP